MLGMNQRLLSGQIMRNGLMMRGFSSKNDSQFEEQRRQVLERERKVFDSLSDKDK